MMAHFDVTQELRTIIKDAFKLTDVDRQAIHVVMLAWVDRARKRPMPDLEDRVEALKAQLAQLAQALNVEVMEAEGRLRLRCPGHLDQVLVKLAYGFTWMEPWNTMGKDLENAIIRGR
jgi:hypothetical protein